VVAVRMSTEKQLSKLIGSQVNSAARWGFVGFRYDFFSGYFRACEGTHLIKYNLVSFLGIILKSVFILSVCGHLRSGVHLENRAHMYLIFYCILAAHHMITQINILWHSDKLQSMLNTLILFNKVEGELYK